MKIKKYFGTKEFYMTALAVAFPLMLQQLITTSVNLIDNLMVGQLGDTAIGAVAAVNKYFNVATFGTNGVITAACIFLAQFYGARQEERMRQTFRITILSAYAIMIPFVFLGLVFPEPIIGFFIKDPAIIEVGKQYIQFAAWTFVPMALSLCVGASLRAVGLTKTPLAISSCAVLINTVLNYCMILGNFGFPRMGVVGAAIATLIARVVEMGLYLIILAKTEVAFKTSVKDLFNVPKILAQRVLVKAAPLCANEVLWSFGMAMLFKFYSTRGQIVMSGYSIASTIGDIFFVLFGGMAAATTVLVSQPLGANKLEEGKRNGYQLIVFSAMLSVVFAAAMFASTFVIPHLYTGISPEARRIAVLSLYVQSAMFWIYMINTQCYFTLRSGGDMKSTLILDSVFMWCVNLPLVGLTAYLTDASIVVLYLLGQSTDFVKLCLSTWLVRKEKWVRNLTNLEESNEIKGLETNS